MKRRVIRYVISDLLADLRAWLWSMYMDERQMIELFEADARAALIRAKGGLS